MKLEVSSDVEWFAERAGEFLAARLERNLLATVLASISDWRRHAAVEAISALGTDPNTGEPLAAALRTPPWQMLATGFADPQAARPLVELWLEHDPELSGVSGEPRTARAIAAAWAACTGGTVKLTLSELLHELTAVIAPQRPAPGRLRQATEADRATLIEWDRAFASEVPSGDPQLAAARVARRLAAGQHYIWDDRGPVSMLAHSAMIAGAPRIGPVYTPPQLRGRGYATSAVAALSQLLLDRGATCCLLYTDVNNPTSNHIYASIGYRPFAEWEVHDFILTGDAPTTNS